MDQHNCEPTVIELGNIAVEALPQNESEAFDIRIPETSATKTNAPKTEEAEEKDSNGPYYVFKFPVQRRQHAPLVEYTPLCFTNCWIPFITGVLILFFLLHIVIGTSCSHKVFNDTFNDSVCCAPSSIYTFYSVVFSFVSVVLQLALVGYNKARRAEQQVMTYTPDESRRNNFWFMLFMFIGTILFIMTMSVIPATAVFSIPKQWKCITRNAYEAFALFGSNITLTCGVITTEVCLILTILILMRNRTRGMGQAGAIVQFFLGPIQRPATRRIGIKSLANLRVIRFNRVCSTNNKDNNQIQSAGTTSSMQSTQTFKDPNKGSKQKSLQLPSSHTKEYGSETSSKISTKPRLPKRSQITPTSIIFEAPFATLPAKFRLEETCSICTDDYQQSSYVLILPCEHHAHADCLFAWLYKNETCHICRAVVRS